MPNVTCHVITQWKIQSSVKRLDLPRSFSCLVITLVDPQIYVFKVLQTLEASEGCREYQHPFFHLIPQKERV